MQDESEILSQAMAILGKRTSEKKARQSRINGRKHKGKRAASRTNANGSEIVSSTENKVEEKD